MCDEAFAIRLDLWIATVSSALVIITAVIIAVIAQTHSLRLIGPRRLRAKDKADNPPPLVKGRPGKDIIELTRAQLTQMVAEAVRAMLEQEFSQDEPWWQQGDGGIEGWGTDD
jgi:hypothetical protein